MRCRADGWGVPPSKAPSRGRRRSEGGMTNSGTSQKTARHVTLSASQPAMTGPMSAGTTHAAASTEKALGLRSTGYERAMRT